MTRKAIKSSETLKYKDEINCKFIHYASGAVLTLIFFLT